MKHGRLLAPTAPEPSEPATGAVRALVAVFVAVMSAVHP